MFLRHESANLTLPLSEMELPKELEALCVVAPRPAVMVGHRPVLYCDSGVSVLPPPDHAYPSWLEEELLDLKLVGA